MRARREWHGSSGTVRRLFVGSISSEDHRKLPSADIGSKTIEGRIAVGCVDEVLYVANPSDGAIYASNMSATVHSDAYRIQRLGKNKRLVAQLRQARNQLHRLQCGPAGLHC